jgi:hypothetical protein
VRKSGIHGGTRLSRKDPAVKANPDSYVPVVPSGLKRADALLALETMQATDGDGTVTVVHAGQWVPRDHALVQLHPHLFVLPTPERPSE